MTEGPNRPGNPRADGHSIHHPAHILWSRNITARHANCKSSRQTGSAGTARLECDSNLRGGYVEPWNSRCHMSPRAGTIGTQLPQLGRTGLTKIIQGSRIRSQVDGRTDTCRTRFPGTEGGAFGRYYAFLGGYLKTRAGGGRHGPQPRLPNKPAVTSPPCAPPSGSALAVAARSRRPPPLLRAPTQWRLPPPCAPPRGGAPAVAALPRRHPPCARPPGAPGGACFPRPAPLHSPTLPCTPMHSRGAPLSPRDPLPRVYPLSFAPSFARACRTRVLACSFRRIRSWLSMFLWVPGGRWATCTCGGRGP